MQGSLWTFAKPPDSDDTLIRYVPTCIRQCRMCSRMQNYKLDPAWYYTSPGLAWDAMLKRTGIRLELLTDIDPPSCIRQRPRTSSEYKKMSIDRALSVQGHFIVMRCPARPQ